MGLVVNGLVFPQERVVRNLFQDELLKNDGFIKVDIKDLGESYSLEADFPGVNKEDISINYNNKILTIKASRKEEKVENNRITENADSNENANANVNVNVEKYILRERKSYSTSRSFKVENIIENEIEASYNNGVLKVILPKRKNEIPKEGVNVVIK